MTSIVSICNLALSNLGKENIQALTDAGAEARACRQFYEHTRDTLLQIYPWRFAGATLSMAAVENDRDGQWSFAYSRPNDCLKIRALRGSLSASAVAPGGMDGTSDPSVKYETDGALIYCNLSPAMLRYTMRMVDPTTFPPLFVEALSWHLAVKLAMPLTRDPKVRADAYQLAMVTQGKAEMADANEVRENSDHRSELVGVRGMYGGSLRRTPAGSTDADPDQVWYDEGSWNE